MKLDKLFVITINRELGSGGRTVGRKLAEKLGVEFFDKALIKALQEKYHLSVEEIEKLKGRKQGWWADFKRTMTGGEGTSVQYYLPKMGDEPELLDTDAMFKSETEILKGLSLMVSLNERPPVLQGEGCCGIMSGRQAKGFGGGGTDYGVRIVG